MTETPSTQLVVHQDREHLVTVLDGWTAVLPDVVELSRAITDTEFVPIGLRGSVGGTAAAILFGREVGLGPMAALQGLHVVKGKVGMAAEMMRARVLEAGHEIEFVESNTSRCVVRGRRKGQERWTDVTYSIDDAKAAGLIKPMSAWTTSPRRMLQARASSELCQMIFPDVIRGMSSSEELDDVEDAGPSTVGGGRSTVQRKTRAINTLSTKGEPVEARGERPALEGPPLPGEPGYIEPTGSVGEGRSEGNATADIPAEPVPESGDDHTLTPPVGQFPEAEEEAHPGDDAPDTNRDDTPPPRPATKADLRMFHAAWNNLKTELPEDADEAREIRLALCSQIIGREITTSNELAQSEARLIADTVARVHSLSELYALLTAADAGA